MLMIGVLCYGKVIINGLCSSLANFVETIVRLLEFVKLGLGRLRFAIEVVYFREEILGKTVDFCWFFWCFGIYLYIYWRHMMCKLYCL